MDEVVKYLKAMVSLQAQSMVEVEQRQKTEVLLARAGLKYGEIAEIIGKTEAAVSKAVSRAK